MDINEVTDNLINTVGNANADVCIQAFIETIQEMEDLSNPTDFSLEGDRSSFETK